MRIRASKITNLVYFGATRGVQQSEEIPELGKAPRGRSSEFARVSGWFLLSSPRAPNGADVFGNSYANFPRVGAITGWRETVRGGVRVGCGLRARGATGIAPRGDPMIIRN